ncbi:MAG: hypothetical protein II954_09745 [Synergistaceae bacterium]|nr:hypothetical protein [Synergistaceae bacterium]
MNVLTSFACAECERFTHAGAIPPATDMNTPNRLAHPRAFSPTTGGTLA